MEYKKARKKLHSRQVIYNAAKFIPNNTAQ